MKFLVAIKCECGAFLLNPFGVRDAILLEKTAPAQNRELLEEKTAARMIFLMYRGLYPLSDPLVWHQRESGPGINLLRYA